MIMKQVFNIKTLCIVFYLIHFTPNSPSIPILINSFQAKFMYLTICAVEFAANSLSNVVDSLALATFLVLDVLP